MGLLDPPAFPLSEDAKAVFGRNATPSLDEQSAGRNLIGAVGFQDLPRTTQRLGTKYVSGSSAAVGANFCYVMTASHYGQVSKIDILIQTLGSGALSFVLLRETAPAVFTVVDTYPITFTSIGPKVLYPSIDFPEVTLGDEDYIGIQVVTGGALPAYLSSSGPGIRFKSGVVSGAGNTFGLLANQTLYYQVTVEYIAETTVPLTTKTAPLESASLTALPAGWSNPAAMTFSASGAQSTSTGITKKLQANKQYGLLTMAHKGVFEIRDLSNVVAIGTNPVEQGNFSGSIIYIHASTGAVAIGERYTGSNTPTEIASGASGITFGVGKKYSWEWIKNGRSFTFTIMELNGPGYYSVTRAATPIGYGVYPAFGYDQGTMQGQPFYCWFSGGATGPRFISLESYAVGSVNPKLYWIGDSRAENFGVTDAQGVQRLIGDEIGLGQCLVSGVGGSITARALPRLISELEFIKPEIIVIDLGTNAEASYLANLTALVAAATDTGALVAVCTIAVSAPRTADVVSLPSTVRKIYLDIAMTASGAGSSLVTSLYTNVDAMGTPYNDSVHDNSAGKLQTVRRVRTDLFEVFE